MKQEKFLTVYAVLDEATQQELTQLQNQILKKYPKGTQTMEIPFHISLGSFPVSLKEELVQRIVNCTKEMTPFSLDLQSVGHFNNKVIFIEPKINEALVNLHQQFDGNFADGFSWHPHITLYIGMEEDGKEILSQLVFKQKTAQIVAIELGKFFPTEIIINCPLKNNNL